MKKRMALIIALAILGTNTAVAWARPGDASDPLVTRSYVDKQVAEGLTPLADQMDALQQNLDQLLVRSTALQQQLAELLLSFKDIAAIPEKVAIIKAVKLGWMQGNADRTFRPKAALARRDLALFLVRAKGVPLSRATTKYKDVKVTDPLARMMVTAAEKKLVPARSRFYFGANQAVTRGEMAYYLARNFPELMPKAGTRMPKVKDSSRHWAKTSIQKAVVSGLMPLDKQGKFYPNRLLTRAEAAAIMAKVAAKKNL
ncbi:MAG: S-layer homology domain-containing protein [Bacillota bacterium]